ncbi:recombinase family protein [Actinacidiphila soli]|uniref:recombinase family protein n=1 Tax=Actinacidiphila soli TaxID=2487275 RepID=UPI000FCA4D0F|nr:recombinase family protein [Actinacidiphila soli]
MPTAMGTRALAAIRLSANHDHTTSPGRQREADETAAEALGLVIIGWAEDLNVSASKVSPFDRPQLGDWLQRPSEFDAIIWWRLDRAVRSMGDMAELAKWAKAHKKRLVFAEGPAGGVFELDMGSPFGELIMLLLAFAAQMEAQAIQERVTGARAAMRSMTRWPGGQPPYGYQLAKNPKGPGYVLEADPEASVTVQWMARRVLEGASIAEIARKLTENEKTPAPRDHVRRRAQREEAGSIWMDTTVRHILTSPAVLGQLMHKGNPLRDLATGAPRQVGPPILERETYDAIQAQLSERTSSTAGLTRKDTKAMLLGVLHCGHCEGRMYRKPPPKSRPTAKPRYECTGRARGGQCPHKPSVRADWVEEYAGRKYMETLGFFREYTDVTHGGYDPTAEMEAVQAELKEHMKDRDLFKSKAGQQEWRDRAQALEARLATLEEAEVIPSSTERIYGSRTFAEAWLANDDDLVRRGLLLSAGVTVRLVVGGNGDTGALDESRLTFSVGDQVDPEEDATEDALRQALL